uniref:MADF domain-containing protein n=1 Tax=Cyprinus carpio TaxID=7962 RepID=A0A8C1PH71_CYPCA
MAERLERLILSVSKCAVLYDLSDEGYRDINRKAAAVEESCPGLEDVKKKWRDLRDAYVRYRREDQSRRVSGAAASQKRPWRYAQIMSFLLPFITERVTDTDHTQESVRPHEIEGTSDLSGECRRRRRVVSASPSAKLEKDPDQAFLDSLLPALKRMSIQKNAATKLKMHQLIYEAEFECNDIHKMNDS